MPPSQIYDPPDHRSPTPPLQQEPPEDIPAGPSPLNHDMDLSLNSSVDELKKTARFVDALRGATLEQSNMRPEDIERLRAADPDPRLDVMDEHFVKALQLFLSTTNASRTTYDNIRAGMLRCYPNDPFLSFWQVKQRVEQLSGVVPIFSDMCPDTCIGFTGPLDDCDHCPLCGKDHYRSGTRVTGS